MPDDDLHRLTGRLRHLLTSPGDDRLVVLFGAGMSMPAVPGVSRLTKMARDFADQAGSSRPRADLNEPVPVYRNVQQMRIARYIEAMQLVHEVRGHDGVRHFLQTAISHAHVGSSWSADEYPVSDNDFAGLQNKPDGWNVPEGVSLFADILRNHGSRIEKILLTTNFDPLIEVALRRANLPFAKSHAVTPGHANPKLPSDPAAWTVVHLHGDSRARTTHYPAALGQIPEDITTWLAAQIRGKHLLVLGYSGWDGLIQQTMQTHFVRDSEKRDGAVEVMWAVYEPQDGHAHMNPELVDFFEKYRMRGVTPYYGIDRDRVLRTLAEELDGRSATVGDPFKSTGSVFYRMVKQLNTDYGFGLSRMRPETQPSFVFWPHRLRAPHLIHGVHALTAALLSKVGVPVELHLDDTEMHPRHAERTAAEFVEAVNGWFETCGAPAPPTAYRISELIDSAPAHERATQLWFIARDWYASSNSVFEALLAAKVITVESESVTVIPNQAQRLLRPMYTWLALDLALKRFADDSGRIPTAVTLGGIDEKGMWDLWRARTSAPPISSIFVPRLESPTEGAKLWDYVELRKDTPYGVRELERFLTRLMGSPAAGEPLLQWVHLAARLATLAGAAGNAAFPLAWPELAEQLSRAPGETCRLLADSIGAWFYDS